MSLENGERFFSFSCVVLRGEMWVLIFPASHVVKGSLLRIVRNYTKHVPSKRSGLKRRSSATWGQAFKSRQPQMRSVFHAKQPF